MLEETDTSAELPAEIKTATRRVARAMAELAPPGNFTVLIEQLAQEMAHAGITPGTAMFEPFLQMQLRALIQRVRGICDEQGIELEEEIAQQEAAPRSAWSRWWRRDRH